MKRLTYPLDTINGIEYRENKNVAKIIKKLGKLEDMEEEIGIDLLTLYKISKQRGIWHLCFAGYRPNGGRYYRIEFVNAAGYRPVLFDFYGKRMSGPYPHSFDKYKVTWAATEGELKRAWKGKAEFVEHKGRPAIAVSEEVAESLLVGMYDE